MSCSQCGEWLHPRSVARHVKSRHSGVENESVKCELCGSTLKSRDILKDHMRKTHNV